MARVSKTSPFQPRRTAESRSNDGGQEQRENTHPEPEPEDGEKSSLSSDEEYQEQEKKRKGKGKAPMKKPAKRGRSPRGEPIKGVVIGIPKVPETAIDAAPKRGKIGSSRKTTFAALNALYDAEISKQKELAKKSEETDEIEEDEACKRFKVVWKMDDDKDKDDDVMPGLRDIKV